MKWAEEILNDYIVPGKIKPTELFVTHRVDLEQTPAIYEAMDDKNSKDRVIKAFIQTKFTDPSSLGSVKLATLSSG